MALSLQAKYTLILFLVLPL